MELDGVKVALSSTAQTASVHAPSRPPFVGIVPLVERLLTTGFASLVQLIVLPIRLLVLPFHLMFKVRFTGKVPEQARRSPGSSIASIAASMRSDFASGATRSWTYRMKQLRAIEAMVVENDAAIFAAYAADLGKPKGEWFLEKQAIIAEINHAAANLATWMQHERRSTPLWMLPASSHIQYEPLGTCLVIGPYNYPLNLCLCPLIAAISAGCNVVLKPSELCPETSAVMARLLPAYLDSAAVAVVEGAIPETTALLEEKWDKIFFTGSTRVASIIEKKVAGSLTPLCLELGGKSPVFVDSSADLACAARRIAHGKFVNAGATCIAPDYVLVEKKAEARLLKELKKTIVDFFGEDPQSSPDYGRVLHQGHLDRLVGMLKGSGEVVVGGTVDAEDRYLAPTILSGVPHDSPVMDEEIFGPILPVLTVTDVDHAISIINSRPKPLAAYVFSSRGSTQRKILARCSSGSACINEAVFQVVNPDIPFGGVGPSGMGNYHGHEGFLCFSHAKGVVNHDTHTDKLTWFRYPPFTTFAERVLGIAM